MSKERRVAILPKFLPSDHGGVARHVLALHKHLPSFGWLGTEHVPDAALVHTHAIDTWPELDVYTNHGIFPLSSRLSRWQYVANHQIFSNIKLARRVIAVSEWTADQWSSLVAVRPTVIHNGVDLEDWNGVPRGRWRTKLKIPEKRKLVLWGKTSLSDVLDPSPAIEIALRRPDVTVVAPLSPKLLPHAPKNFVCVSPQPFDSMKMLLADCDVYLATVCENHSVQLLEAMALSKPILGYAWGGTKETISQTEAGILVPAGDLSALLDALEVTFEQAPALGASAREVVAERFQWKDLVGRIAEVYDSAMEEKVKEQKQPQVKCSIVIPVYNKATWVAEAIASALSQRDAPPYEVIVVDDGSTDGSLEEVRKSLKEFTAPGIKSRIIVQKNAGVAAARNRGIQEARGKYVCCLDADDLIEPTFLARLSAVLDADPELGIAYSDFAPFGFDPKRGGQWSSIVRCDEYDFEKLRRGNILPCCNLFRKVAWARAGGYKDINPSWEDYELWLNMGKLGWSGKRVAETLFRYRVLPTEGRNHESQGQEWRLRAVVNSYHRDLYPPFVSVVIPCYKQAQFLAESVSSALAQTFPDTEVVVVDDGNSAEEANRIAEIVRAAGPTVRLVRITHNSGLATARNAGISVANGEWIVPLDADDVLYPTFIEKCLLAVQRNPRLFAYTDSALWWTNGSERLQEIFASEYSFLSLLNSISWPCSILVSKVAWQEAGGYKPAMSSAGGWEDWEFAITMGEIGICGVRVPEVLFKYRQHSPEQMRHGANDKKAVLQEAMRRLHAATYRGEFPMSCCGRGRVATPEVPAVPDTRGAVARRGTEVAGSTVLIRYSGPCHGASTFRTPGGSTYRFGLSDPVKEVLSSDAEWFLSLPHFQAVPR